MVNNLIPQELDALIQEYLTDGVLTDKERQVILRKAEGLGLDRDEIDLYLDAQVQKIDQVTDAAVRRQKGKTCPFCGAPVPQLADKCPECGQFITPEASEELKDILENLEESLIDFKSGKDMARSKAGVERYVRKAKMYYSNNPKIKPLLADIEIEMEAAEKRAKVMSRNEDIKTLLYKRWTWFGIEAFIIFIVLISLFIHYNNIPFHKVDFLILVLIPVFIASILALVFTARWASRQKS